MDRTESWVCNWLSIIGTKMQNRKWIILIIALFFVVFVLVIRMRIEDIVRRLSSSEKKTDYQTTMGFVPDEAYPWVAKLRMRKIIPHVKENDTVLEYGVRFGWNLALIKCKKRLGFDLSDSLAPIVREHGIEFINDLVAISDDSIDVIICHHQLEHELAPAEVLSALKRILRPNGKLLLFVPYEKGKRTLGYDMYDRYHRLYSWNVQTLGNLVKANGFKVIEGQVGRYGYERFSAVLANRYKLGELGFRVIRRAIHLVRPGYEVELVATKD